jgi:hypothetical protein
MEIDRAADIEREGAVIIQVKHPFTAQRVGSIEVLGTQG